MSYQILTGSRKPRILFEANTLPNFYTLRQIFISNKWLFSHRLKWRLALENSTIEITLSNH